jgi:hypothetical protein
VDGAVGEVRELHGVELDELPGCCCRHGRLSAGASATILLLAASPRFARLGIVFGNLAAHQLPVEREGLQY